MEHQVKRIKRELKIKGAIVNFYTDYMQLPHGGIAQWDFVEHPKAAAAVVAVLPDGKLLMVKQYRNALERVTLEIPAGARDSREEPFLLCASRELEEETGYHSDNLKFLISLRSTIAFCDEQIEVFVARDLVKTKQHLDADEFVEVESYELDELVALIYQGKIQDGKTVAAILAFKNLETERNQ